MAAYWIAGIVAINTAQGGASAILARAEATRKAMSVVKSAQPAVGR